ncbi:MAG: hypothetical protein COA84_13860 [Robiginitomaculum sp.]|nr:MAG: hypothetical protein COA84_13860 [Robiginitomaculum sp.]
MKIMTILVGLPGTGKSTFIEKNVNCQDAFVYSTDRYITDIADSRGLTYDDVFSDTIGDATVHMNSNAYMAFRDGKSIIWDQTNLGVKKRAKIIKRAKQAGYTTLCYYAPAPKSLKDVFLWIDRLANRPNKTIPKHIMQSMIEQYVEPTNDEGFDCVSMFDMHGNITVIPPTIK